MNWPAQSYEVPFPRGTPDSLAQNKNRNKGHDEKNRFGVVGFCYLLVDVRAVRFNGRGAGGGERAN